MHTNEFFEKLWEKYISMTPQALKIHDAFAEEDGDIVNDHVAFRTFNGPQLGITTLERHFLSLGYTKDRTYHFVEKKLDAASYLHHDDNLPRIFISELRREELSLSAQKIIQHVVNQVPATFTHDIACLWHGKEWETPTWEDYQALLSESEYAAWLLVHGLCANHFTISVNHLRNPELELVNLQVDALGFKINDHGGAIKGSPEDMLEQSSTFADNIPVTFADGTTHDITSCYYEFAKRYNDDAGNLFQGFITANADKIFESTDMKK